MYLFFPSLSPAYIVYIGLLHSFLLLLPVSCFDLFLSSLTSALSKLTAPCRASPQLRPLYELVKEVQCAGLKQLNLRRATEQYLAEEHPCHCRPCRNNGQPLLSATECVCVCRPGTSGLACEKGSVIGEPAGEIGRFCVAMGRFREGLKVLSV